MHSLNPWLAAIILQPLCRDLIAFVFIGINTQSPWVLRRGIRIDAQSEPMASWSFPIQPLCRDLRAFVFINIDTQSPWLLRRGIMIGPWLYRYTKPMAPAQGSWKLCTVGLQFQCLYNKYNCSYSHHMVHFRWIVDCRMHCTLHTS